ncbi:MAG TPA: Na+/H+ antiporter subunit E [Clostridia bacterium]|nr:Na+/H+ antiporter subunit E [Clostridia bacterium]
MAASFIFNIFVALVWTFLKGEFNLVNLVWGYILGAGILFLFPRIPPGKVYTKKILGFIDLALVFLVELWKANVAVLKQVCKGTVHPPSGIVAYPLEVKSDWGITVLANLITLTPGTISMEVSPDRKTLYIHTLEIEDPQAVIDGIKQSFERRILEVFE